MAAPKEIAPEASQEAAPQEIPAAVAKGISVDEQATIEEKWGIRVLPVRLNANEFLVDFRYQVIDPEKALPLLDRSVKPYLIDEASGQKSYVPSYPNVGSLRAKGSPMADRNYFILFGNSAGAIRKGSKVTVVIGDFKVENLVVE